MGKRTTIEVDPLILKAIQLIAVRRKLKVKTVSDQLLRYSIPWEKTLFAKPTKEKRTSAG